jgi:hypothetical protein
LLVCLAVLLCLGAATARAEAVRFRYAPADASGTLAQVPAGPGGAIGEKLSGLGLVPQPFTQSFRPNQMVTFRHAYGGRNVVVPLTLPRSTPRIEHRAESVIFNYGSYTAEVRFLPDGAVDVIYNSGFLRPLVVE